MVLYPVASQFIANMEKPGANVTGAAMDVPVERQLRVLQRMMPKLKRVGVLYSPQETLLVIEEAKRVAKAMNIQMIAESVSSESDVPDALGRLDKQRMDALWSVADGKVFTRPSTRYIIEYVVHRGIPFMGPHNGFVKAGALVALTADYRDNGRQAGEIAIQILNGVKPESIPVATPRKIEMAVNLQVSNNIGLKIPQSVIEDAAQVFE
jgi:putative ABC transport system substrate-binding protein